MKVLFYALFKVNPQYKQDAYVVAHYSNGSIRYWYPEDRGFKSAKAKALADRRIVQPLYHWNF